ncbi:MAG: hypothetical protein II978_02015 [Clostridia bacterium]|nr:hypothetical protein [Clostridia bacterium]
MDKSVEIFDVESEAFSPVHSFEGWTVGVINFADRLKEENVAKVECHLQTDEFFIPVLGKSVLHIGRNREQRIELEIGKAYNVKKGVWHAVSMSEDAKIFVVENSGTGIDNSEIIFDR